MIVEITKTIKFCFNDEEYRKMKEEFDETTDLIFELTEKKDVVLALTDWFDKYFEFEHDQNL